MSKTMYTYFIYYSVILMDNQVSECNSVIDVDFKIESKGSIEAIIKLLANEVNPQLLLQGFRARQIIIKNFIIMNEVVSVLNLVNN